MIKKLFPTSLYETSLAPAKSLLKLNGELKEEILKLRQIDVEGQAWSNKNYRGGYTSYGSMDKLHRFSSTFEDLEKMIRQHIKTFVKHLEMDIHPDELTMSSCWVNVMPKDVIHTMHIHPLSVISGTYYVQTPPNSGTLKIEDPRMDCFMASPPRKNKAREENQRYYHHQPKAGQVVLFESWTRHEVPANRSAKDRISISFNYDWTGR